MMKNAVTPVTAIQIPMITQNPHTESPNGTATFMPHKLAMSVGIVMISVITASSFMTVFTLLEITEAYASIVPDKISR